MNKQKLFCIIAIALVLLALVPVGVMADQPGRSNFTWLVTRKLSLLYGGAQFLSDLTMNGNNIYLDDDDDTYLETATDDTINVYIGDALDFTFTANTFTAQSGSTIAAQAVTLGGDLTLENGETITNTVDGDVGLTVTNTFLVFGGDLEIADGDITLQNGETIGNATDKVITVTVPADGSLDVSTGNFQVGDGTPDTALDGEDVYIEGRLEVDEAVDFDGAVDIAGNLDVAGDVAIAGGVVLTRTTTTDEYANAILAEWIAGDDMAAGGSNGIYSIIDPIQDVSNAYALRGRVDLRKATASVTVNQLHGLDTLVNINETQVYSVTDNLSGVGTSIHGGASGDVIPASGSDAGTLNLFYGAWGDTATQDFTSQTNGLLLLTHNDTVVDYGIQVQSSSNMDAGVYLNSHASDSGAKMDVGIEMTSGADDMVQGINMEAASFSGADIVLDNGESIENSTDGEVLITATDMGVTGQLNDAVITIGTISGDVFTIGIQFNDIAGTALATRAGCMWYLSQDAAGDAIIDSALSGGVAISSDGLLLEWTAEISGWMISESDGDVSMTLEDNGADTAYLVLVMPDGRLIVSDLMNWAS
jgi:hypothetical protein